MGCFAGCDFTKDECVGFYGGMRLIEHNALHTQNTYGYDDRYLMLNAVPTADGVQYELDPRFECSLLRAANNSCEPNCRVYPWYVFVLCAPIVFCVYICVCCMFVVMSTTNTLLLRFMQLDQ